MRARNIKPSIFKNEVLGTADPLLTILFEGLWCEADRDGRLEDRPLRLKAEIFPYRNDANIDTMLDWLCANEFISRYQASGAKVIQVLKFSDHQRPHANEVKSVLPSMEAIKHNQGKKSAQPRKQALRSDSGSLIPSSLIPDPGLLNADCLIPDRAAAQPECCPEFETLKAIYPKRSGSQRWEDAERAARARISEGHTWQQILDGAQRYADFCRETGKERTEHVLQAATFVGRNKEFLTAYERPANKAEIQRDSNISASQEWLRQQGNGR